MVLEAGFVPFLPHEPRRPGGTEVTSLRHLFSARLRFAAGRLPSLRDWLETAVLLIGYGALALPLAAEADIIDPERSASSGSLPLLALRVLLAPAIVEEVLFRVLPNPHPRESARSAVRILAAAGSLAAYVLVHPLAALLSPALRPVFLDPTFILLVALLGSICLISYVRSGSLWPPLVLHWLIVVGWLGLGGRGFLPGGY